MKTKYVALAISISMLVIPSSSFAVSFKGEFFDPPKFWEKVAATPEHPANRYENELRRAFAATLLVGGRATAVVVSPNGLAVTARHVISDIYSTPTEDCAKIPLFLGHEINERGERDEALERVTCDKILVNEVSDDFVLMKLKPRRSGRPYPFSPVAPDPDDLREGMKVLIAGHPHALNYEKGVKKISYGPVVFYAPFHNELPHFLHLVDTEGGSSGAPVFRIDGTLVGIHFRGVPKYGDGVEVTIDGQKQRITKFNVALPMPYLFRKYRAAFDKGSLP